MDGWLTSILGIRSGVSSSSQGQAAQANTSINQHNMSSTCNIQHASQQNMQGGQQYWQQQQQLQASTNSYQQHLLLNVLNSQQQWISWQQFETPEQKHKREFKEKIDARVEDLLNE